MPGLVPCPECARHVRASDTACPFCDHDVSSLASPAHFDPGRLKGLGRAAIFAFGATVGLAAVGCDSTEPVDGGAGPVDAGPGSFDAAYGAPPFDAGTDGG